VGLYVGLMSGTSLDGVDGVLAELGPPLQVRSHVHRAYPEALKAELLALNRAGGVDELHRSAVAANAVALAYGAVVSALLEDAGLRAGDVRAVGAHGQTVRHQPGGGDQGYTLQLLNGALLAERCAIDVVCDLRSRDVAAGGQGAPLVPAFHASRFARAGVDVAVLNVGGIANLTLLGADGTVGGFDCGPGNALMDEWAQRHRGLPFDDQGAWAASAQADPALLARWLAGPYFSLAPPKSTGRDLFNADWLDTSLGHHGRLPPAVVQATLLTLTVRSAADALLRWAPRTTVLRVCGGGARNVELMRSLAACLPGVDVQDTAVEGVAPDQVEALAFAWLAAGYLAGAPGNIPAVTGAAGPRLLGALYRA
jgi:anhydro-N-acetylmuramic acid kinase